MRLPTKKSVKKVRLSAEITCAFREIGQFGEPKQQDAQSAEARYRHPSVFRFLSYFFRRAESSMGVPLAFIPRAWYIVRVLKSTQHHTSLFFIAFSLYSRGKDFAFSCVFVKSTQEYAKGSNFLKGQALPREKYLLYFFCQNFRRAESSPSARLFFLSFLNFLFICFHFPPGGKYSSRPSLPLFLFSFKFLFYLFLFSAARKVCMHMRPFILLALPVFFVFFLYCFLRLSILNVQIYLNGTNTPFFIIFSFSFLVFLL